MSAPPTPSQALHLLAILIAADIRAGSPVLAVPPPSANTAPRGRGRPKSIPVAVAHAESARAA